MTGGAVVPLGPLLLLPVSDSVSATLITLIVSGSLTVNKAAETFSLEASPASILPLFLWKTHTDLHPHNHTHIQTLKTNTQTPPNTPPTVTTSEEWSACGEVVVKELEGKWKPGRGDTVLLLTPRRLVISHAVSRGTRCVQHKLLGTCVFRGPGAAAHAMLRCGNAVISLGWSQIAAGTGQARSQPWCISWVELVQMSSERVCCPSQMKGAICKNAMQVFVFWEVFLHPGRLAVSGVSLRNV